MTKEWEKSIVIHPRKIDAGLEKLQPFLKPDQVLVFNHQKGIPYYASETETMSLYYEIDILPDAGFHSNGDYLPDYEAVVGIVKPEFRPKS